MPLQILGTLGLRMLGSAERRCIPRSESQSCGLISPVEWEWGRVTGPALFPQAWTRSLAVWLVIGSWLQGASPCLGPHGPIPVFETHQLQLRILPPAHPSCVILGKSLTSWNLLCEMGMIPTSWGCNEDSTRG